MEGKKMSFGENLQYLRKKKNITQEELAEQMEVSRQSVSKWESGGSYPDMEKMTQICDLFSCDLDVLIRGNMEVTYQEDTCQYDTHMNQFSKSIAVGVGVVLLGITVMLLMQGFGINDQFSTMVLMGFVVIGVMIFIITGMLHEAFQKKHPYIENFYSIEEVDVYQRKFIFLVAIPIAFILIGVIWLIGSESLPLPKGGNDDIFTAIFFLFITIAVPIMIYAGIQKDKYDIEKYNKTNQPDEETIERNNKIGKWCGCIMLVATIIFLLLGFLKNLWVINWVVYPIGGILCGIVSIIHSKAE